MTYQHNNKCTTVEVGFADVIYIKRMFHLLWFVETYRFYNNTIKYISERTTSWNELILLNE